MTAKIDHTACAFCGTLNRVGRRSFGQIAWCGRCGKQLAKTPYATILGFFRRHPRLIFLVGLWSFLLWAGRESSMDSLSMRINCTATVEPATGIYGRYTRLPRSVDLMIETPPGLNYLVKLVDPQTDAPLLSMFIRGGMAFGTKVPIGTFTLKAASGEQWCGETNLFGGATRIIETGKTISFSPNEIHTVRLSSGPDGNLPVRTIGRRNF